ncbi:hypothetical protein [Gordonia insulae]|uniref:Uncharacterized protein n=1 Tax=Gordonia insulae TaxID=2420509 RepID=A0A3G8JGH7_9ACTN|nr:hypothetical protein [Gordonia insulae]AZG44113.1 hypothetical protein D7316_00693 [Gordonia insulae]
MDHYADLHRLCTDRHVMLSYNGRLFDLEDGDDRFAQRTVSAPQPPENSTMTPAQRADYATSVHESAHAIVATVLGHRVREVKVGPDPEHPHRKGRCVYSTRFDAQDRAAISYAGPYAEQFFLAHPPRQRSDAPSTAPKTSPR